MRQELYIDVFFCVNFVMDLFLLWLLRMILKRPVSFRRLMIGSLAGAAGNCLGVVMEINCLGVGLGSSLESGLGNSLVGGLGSGWILALVLETAEGLILAILMVWLAFRPESLLQMAREVLLFLFLAVCIGGGMEALYQRFGAGGGLPVFFWLFLVAGAWFGFRYLWLNALDMGRQGKSLYKVTLRKGENFLETLGFLDTGNCLREPKSGLPVHIVSEKIWMQLWMPGLETSQIPFSTVGNPWGLMQGMQVDSMEIKEGSGQVIFLKSPWIARAPFSLTKDGGYEILLHEETKS